MEIIFLSKIENLLCLNDEIDHIRACDNKKFLVCLLVLNKNLLEIKK